MVWKCIVKNCKHENTDTFHRIPKNIDQRNIWQDLLDLPDTAKGRVCSKHFEESDFEVKGSNVWLKKNAYPMHMTDIVEASNEVEIDDLPIDDATKDVSVHLNKIYEEHSYAKKTKKDKFMKIKVSTSFNNRCLVMSLRRTLKRTRSQMKKMRKDHKKEMKKFENFSKLSEFLQELFLLLMKHHTENSSPKTYSPEIRKFALSLHYYSPVGYQFVRVTMNKCLPHTQTIASWYRVIDGEPGFTVESLQERSPNF